MRLRHGGDMHTFMLAVSCAGGIDGNWVNPDKAVHKMSPSIRNPSKDRLIVKGWLEAKDGLVTITPAGLQALKAAL